MGGECAPSYMKLWKPPFLIKTLTLKTICIMNGCLIECYMHEIEWHLEKKLIEQNQQ